MNYPGHMAEYRACSKRIQCFGSGLYNTNEIGEEFMEALIIEAVDAADKAGFEKYGIERAAWTYKKMDFGLIDERYSEVRYSTEGKTADGYSVAGITGRGLCGDTIGWWTDVSYTDSSTTIAFLNSGTTTIKATITDVNGNKIELSQKVVVE